MGLMTGISAKGATATPAASLRVFVLGQFRVTVDGHALSDSAWQRPQARRLFKYLATRRFRRVVKESVLELFWPDSEPSAAASNLRSLVFGIRHALQTVGGERLLVNDRESLSLDASAGIWVDADEFEALVAAARTADDPSPMLEAASELYKGDFLADDLFEKWAAEQREALRHTWEDVQFRLAQRYEQRGDQESGLARLLALLLVDRCNERAGQEAMRMLIELGRRPEALRVFNALQVALQDELGVTPSQRTLELQRLATLSATPASLGRSARFRCAYSFPQPGELVGRASELERLMRIVERGRTHGQAVLLSASAGTGKSTLLGAVVRRAQERGVLCLAGGSYDQRSAVPLVAFEEAISDYILSMSCESGDNAQSSAADELVQVVSELRQHLGLDAAPQANVSNARMRLFGAILSFLRTTAERGPLLLCLEDLHAADAASLQLLHFLARQTRHSPVVIIGTFRHEELRPGEPLAQLVSGLEREGIAEHVRLAPLDQQATGKLAELLGGGPIGDTARKALHELTEGNPLFIEQVMLTLGSRDRLAEIVSAGQQIVSQGSNAPLVIKELIARRMADMTKDGRETMGIAAVLGSTFDESTLLAVAEPMDEPALLTHLDEAITAHILRETPNGYAFQHAMLREGVYWNLSRPRRTLLHHRAGDVLERLAKGRIAERAAELAYHFNLAGQSSAARTKAFQYSLMAGRQNQALTAYREAAGHFKRASELVETGEIEADLTARIEVLVGRGEAEQEMGHWAESLKTWEQVLEICSEPLLRARTRSNMAYAHVELGLIDEVAADIQAGLEDLRQAVGPEAATYRLDLLQWSAFVLYLRGRYGETVELGEQMLAEAKLLHGNVRPLIVSHSALAWGYMGLGQTRNALEQYERALEIAALAGHKVHQAMAHQNIGLQHYLSGNFSAAEEHLQRACSFFYDAASESRALHATQLLCQVWIARGELPRAHAQASLALELSHAGGLRWAADSHHILGSIAALRAQWQEAERCFAQALNVRVNVGAMVGAVDSLVALGNVFESSGDWIRARQQFQSALRLAGAMDPGPKLVLAKTHLARLLLRSGESSLAVQLMTDAVILAENIPDTIEYAPALIAYAELRLSEGDPASAALLVERALTREMSIDNAVSAHVLLARVCAVLGDIDSGRTHLAQARALANRLGGPQFMSATALAEGWIAAASGDDESASSAFELSVRQADLARTPYYLLLALEAQIDHAARIGAREPAQRLREMVATLRAKLGIDRQSATSSQLAVSPR